MVLSDGCFSTSRIRTISMIDGWWYLLGSKAVTLREQSFVPSISGLRKNSQLTFQDRNPRFLISGRHTYSYALCHLLFLNRRVHQSFVRVRWELRSGSQQMFDQWTDGPSEQPEDVLRAGFLQDHQLLLVSVSALRPLLTEPDSFPHKSHHSANCSFTAKGRA